MSDLFILVNVFHRIARFVIYNYVKGEGVDLISYF